MTELTIERRRFLQGLAGMGALGLMPAPLLARAADDQWSHVKAYFESIVPKTLSGAVAAVARGMDTPSFVAKGTLAFDNQTAVGPDSLWRIYSMTKPITGMAAMLLVDDGTITLDQPVADFIPGFANLRVLTDVANSLDSRPAKGIMTVRHLLTHTAGLGYTIVTQGPLRDEYIRLGLTPAALSRNKHLDDSSVETAPSLKEFADRLATLPLIADPGTIYSYSVSLDLLGRVIEVASGMPFESFLQKRMFDPLGMKDTVWQVSQKDVGRFASNYFHLAGKVTLVDSAENSVYLDKPPFPFGGAGLVSSARDYDRFLQMLMGEGAIGDTRIMKTETARLAMSNLCPEAVDLKIAFPDGNTGYGAGGRVALRSIAGGEGAGAYGWSGAAGTHGFVDRERRLRGSGFVQFMPWGVIPFPDEFTKKVYADIA